MNVADSGLLSHCGNTKTSHWIVKFYYIILGKQILGRYNS